MLRMQGLRKPVQSVAFAPDGRTLASAGNDGHVHLWEQATGKELASWPAHGYAVLCLAFSPGGRLLASGSFDETVTVWGVATRKALVTLEGRPQLVTAVAFAPDGQTLATAHGDRLSFGAGGGVEWWEVGSWKALGALESQAGATEYAPFATSAEPGNGGAPAERTRYGGILSLAYFADGATLVLGTALAGVVLWDVASRRERAAFYQKGCRAVALSPDGRTVAAAEASAVNLWDVECGKRRATLKGHKGAVWSVAFAPDGKLVLSGAKDGGVRLWEAATGRPLGAFDWDVGTVHQVAFAPDGMTAAVAGHSGAVVLWDVEPDEGAGAPVEGVALPDLPANLPGARKAGPRRLEHKRPVKALAFSPDGQTLASLAVKDCVKLWEAGSGRLRFRVPPGRSREGGSALAFSPDGTSLALATWYIIQVRVWGTRTWVPQAELTYRQFTPDQHPLPLVVGALAFAPSGRHLALGAAASRRVAPAPVEARHATVEGVHGTFFLGGGGISALAFRPDGKAVALATGRDGVVLWDVATHAAFGE
jgi:WD40 repeat protein